MSSRPAPKTVTTPELRVQFYEYGNPAGKPLILLHGFPDAPAAWDGVIVHLDLDKLRILVPCLRGYGGSEVKSLDLVGGQEAALGHDLLAFSDALGLTNFHLAGHDWGARTGYAASLFAPERVQSLLTIGTPYVMYGGKQQPPAQVRAHWYQWAFQLELGAKIFQSDPAAFCHELWRAWSPDWHFSESDFTEAAKSWTNEQFVPTVLHYYRTRWGGALSLRGYEALQATLNATPKPKIAVPSVYIQGGADACDLPACSEDQASFFTGGYERVLLKSAGHFPHREDPKAVAKLITKHLA